MRIYLDYAATTPVDPRVASKMATFLTQEGQFGNPASLHWHGKNAHEAIEHARAQVADLIHANSSEIIWTSGATEANNLAIKGTASLYHARGKHIVTLKTEHPSVLLSCQYLEKQGYYVTYLSPRPNGLLDIHEFQAALRPDTILVSIMHVHNEIGVIQDISQIAEITSSKGIIFHVDAAQSAGKLLLNMQEVPIDLMSMCAHKIYGPKGIGALYVRQKPRRRVAAQIHGGGQEQGMRAGTLATHQIVGMGEALSLAKKEMRDESRKLFQYRERFLKKLPIENRKINGELDRSYPGILNICIPSANAEKLIHDLPMLAFSVGSACLSQGKGLSYVLRALGLSKECVLHSIRLSFGRFTTEEEVDKAAELIMNSSLGVRTLP